MPYLGANAPYFGAMHGLNWLAPESLFDYKTLPKNTRIAASLTKPGL